MQSFEDYEYIIQDPGARQIIQGKLSKNVNLRRNYKSPKLRYYFYRKR